MSTRTPRRSLEESQEHLTTARVNGCPVVVHQAHRLAGHRYGPVLVRVSAPVGLTVEEVTALLYWWVTQFPGSDDPFDDLADDGVVRDFLADMVINDGCVRIGDALDAACRTEDVDLRGYCRQRAVTVFGPSCTTVAGEVAR